MVNEKAICEDCDQQMIGSKTCNHRLLEFSEHQVRERNTTYFDVNDHCHDCGIENKKGNVHHFGCDMERCPLCEGQLLSCECREKYEVIPLNTGSEL